MRPRESGRSLLRTAQAYIEGGTHVRILLALDRSRDSTTAVRLVRRLHPRSGSSLFILHVVEISSGLIDWSLGVSPRARREAAALRAQTARAARAWLREVKAPFLGKTLHVHGLVPEGTPASEIIKAIERYHIDLAVLGLVDSRGSHDSCSAASVNRCCFTLRAQSWLCETRDSLGGPAGADR